jgi:hypothetical protein
LGTSWLFSEVILPAENLLLIDDMRARMEGMAFSGTLIDHGKETVVRLYGSAGERDQGLPTADMKSLLRGSGEKLEAGRRCRDVS